MAIRNIKLVIEYDGGAYAGWQRQPDQPTVQAVIEDALSTLVGGPVTLHGAGRTDAGVHALGQVANFTCDSSIPTEKFAPALQSSLPRDILIKSSSEVSEDFNSRFDATSRTYLYRLAHTRSALLRGHRWECEHQLDIARLQECAELFVGEYDCSALCIPGSLQKSNRCSVRQATWNLVGDELHFTIQSNRFLHSMVRTIVGFCVQSARPSQLTVERIRDILKAGTWTTDHLIAPPQGLYLVKVDY